MNESTGKKGGKEKTQRHSMVEAQRERTTDKKKTPSQVGREMKSEEKI